MSRTSLSDVIAGLQARERKMADFDNFEGANTAEEDPAAEFLAREQTELAGLEDDNFAGDSSAQPGGGMQ